jgi:transcriptional regulator with XRE-family HTH domain
MRRWTQTELAQQLGTTAATVSRLETADMNVSLDWLQRFADAFGVPVTALVDEASARPGIPYIGRISGAGRLLAPADGEGHEVTLDGMARDPIAMRFRDSIGAYRAGDIIIADRMSSEGVPRALGRDCLVDIEGEEGCFGRFISSDHGTYLLVPPEPGAETRSLPLPGWVAPVVMLIRHL